MRALLLVTLGLSLCACEDPAEGDAGPADTGVVVDTGFRDTGSPIDTGLDAGQADALLGDADASLDATPDDADPTDADPTDVTPADGGPRTGPLTVIFEEGSAVGTAGVAMFQDATGALRATRTTTVGLIVETIEEGWMVTITNSLQGPSYLFTVTEVAPNETYRVASYIDSPQFAVMTVAFTDTFAGATSYWYETGCPGGRIANDPSETTVVGISDACTSPTGTIDFSIVARDNNLDLVAFKLLQDVPVVDGTTVTLTDPWRTDFDTVDIVVSNAPTGATYLQIQAAVRSNGANYGYDSANLFFSGGGGTYTIVRPPFGEGLDTIYEMQGPGGRSFLQKTAGAPVDQTYDLSVDFLPFPGPVTLTASPIVGRPIATWPAMAGLDLVDLQILSFNQNVKWSVFLRGDATTFMYPELPVELAPQAPEDLVSFLTATRVIDAESVPDYAAARATIGASVFNWPEQFDHHHQPLGAQVRGAGFELDFK